MLSSIFEYFPSLTSNQKNQIAQLEAIYKYWNNKINVVSRKDIDNLYEHHVLHSLAIAKFVNFKAGTKLMDYGTGGGFPGIPLAIMFPDCNFDLVDSVGKKIIVAEAVAKELALQNVNIYHLRAEQIDKKYDFIISRAVAKVELIWPLIQNKVSNVCYNDQPNGLLYLRGQENQIVSPKDSAIKQWPIAQVFKEDYFSTKVLVLLSKSSKISTNG